MEHFSFRLNSEIDNPIDKDKQTCKKHKSVNDVIEAYDFEFTQLRREF